MEDATSGMLSPMPIQRSLAAVKQDYDRDGFVILRGYLEDPELADLRERADRLANDLFAQMSAKGKRSSQFPNVLKNLNATDTWFAELLNNGPQVPLVKLLVGDELHPATAAWFDRPRGANDSVEPHVDAVGQQRGPHVGATMWIALDAAAPDNGCLYYGRGSHQVEYPPVVGIPGFDRTKDATPAVVDPGDAVIHNALTVHWSGPNRSARPRRAVSFFYWGKSAAAKSAYWRKSAAAKGAASG